MSSDPQTNANDAGYFEKLTVPWWWYLAGMAVGFLLAIEFTFAMPYPWGYIPIAVLVPAAVLLVRRFSAGRIRVQDGVLTIGEHRLEVSRVTQTIPLPAGTVGRLVGRYGDPTAVVYIRSWIKTGVQIMLEQSTQSDDDRVPYWVISTRTPDRLVDALTAARTGHVS